MISKAVQLKRIPEKKKQTVQRVIELSTKFPVIAVASLSKVRGEQLMAVRKALRGNAEILVVKNKLAILGLEQAGIAKIDELKKYLIGQNALIFSSINPFKLYILLEKNKVFLPARAGDIAQEDILVPAGNTGLQAGPVLSEFREAGIPTKIESGSVYIVKDTVVAKKGTVISAKLASLLSKLNIKPIKAGISIVAAYYDGLVLRSEDVSIDLDRFGAELIEAFKQAKHLALELGYITRETAYEIIAMAYNQALQLAIYSNYVTKETLPYIIARTEAEARALEEEVKS